MEILEIEKAEQTLTELDTLADTILEKDAKLAVLIEEYKALQKEYDTKLITLPRDLRAKRSGSIFEFLYTRLFKLEQRIYNRKTRI